MRCNGWLKGHGIDLLIRQRNTADRGQQLRVSVAQAFGATGASGRDRIQPQSRQAPLLRPAKQGGTNQSFAHIGIGTVDKKCLFHYEHPLTSAAPPSPGSSKPHSWLATDPLRGSFRKRL